MKRPAGARERRSPLSALLNLLIFVGMIAGLALLAVALFKATPPVSFGTEEEILRQRAGRRLIPIAVAILVVPTLMLALRGRWLNAVLVALPGIVSGTLVFSAPQTLFGALAYLALSPIAIATTIASLTSRGP